MKAKREVRQASGSVAVDFTAALVVLLVLSISPMLNLCALSAGFAQAYLAGARWAVTAGHSSDPGVAASLVEQDAELINQSIGFRLAKVRCTNVAVYVIRKRIVGELVEYLEPLRYAPAPLDSTSYIYEYLVLTEFEQQPFVSLSGVPLINKLSGLGKGWTFRVKQVHGAEHIEGLSIQPYTARSAEASRSCASWQRGWPSLDGHED